MNDIQPKTVLVTGGAGFIGSALVRHLVQSTPHYVINVDKLTYAGNLESLSEIDKNSRYEFEHADICDNREMERIFLGRKPELVFHLAAESHVDRSIDGPSDFIQTNLVGTFNLLEKARQLCNEQDEGFRNEFRFVHVSTDEVYGTLGDEGFFTETTPYQPSSPYSASKAGSDHLARAWQHTFGLPVMVTNCSNNYGPYQFPEKLIPVIILKALRKEPIPVYGKGANVRDWLFVEDHVHALMTVGVKGYPGETYNIGGNNERQNIEVVRTVCEILDEILPNKPEGGHASLIHYVKDRPGHDLRYAIDASFIRDRLGWQPQTDFKTGIRKTVEWYLDNRSWWERIFSGEYRMERIGLGEERCR